MVTAESLPEDVRRVLWDVDLATFDPEGGRALIIERVMSRGSWDAMRWLRKSYPLAALADFVRTRGRRALAPRDLAYWALVCDVDLGPEGPGAGGGRPPWAGP
jgi:hypothetical protein